VAIIGSLLGQVPALPTNCEILWDLIGSCSLVPFCPLFYRLASSAYCRSMCTVCYRASCLFLIDSPMEGLEMKVQRQQHCHLFSWVPSPNDPHSTCTNKHRCRDGGWKSVQYTSRVNTTQDLQCSLLPLGTVHSKGPDTTFTSSILSQDRKPLSWCVLLTASQH
jgi:hypothetical protein